MRNVVTTAALAIALAVLPAAAASAARPGAAALSDRKGDGESRPFDIHRMKGFVVGKRLVLVMRVQDLTKRNVAPVQGPSSSTLKAILGLHLRVNGERQPRYMVTRSGRHGDEAVVRTATTKQRVDCTRGGDDLQTARRGSLRLHLGKDTARFTVPLWCLPGVRTVSFTGYTVDSRDGSLRYDKTNRRGSTARRWSAFFSVR
jgi:hypothetical protein